MAEAKIPGGYIILSRKIIESEIWNKPPLYLKVWIYLLSCAQHGNYKKLKRGQLRTSIPEIIEACSWKVGYRKVKPTKDQVYQVIDWLRKASRNGDESNCESNTKAPMITTTKATQGMIVTIENYDFYQTPANYESNKESDAEHDAKATREQRQPDNINKNDNNSFNNGINNNPADEPLPDLFEIELTEEQKLEVEIEEYYQIKRLKIGPVSPKDRDLIKQAIYEEKFTREEIISGINEAVSIKGPNGINSFEYCLKVMRTERQKRLKAQQQKKVVPINRRTDKPDNKLPMVLRPEFQQLHQKEMSAEEFEAQKKAFEERVRRFNEKVPKVGEQ